MSDEPNIGENSRKASYTKAFTVHLNPWALVIVLLLAMLAQLFVWQPWHRTSSDRTISVSGSSIVKAEPDEYIFTPGYEFQNVDKDAGLNNLTVKSDEVTAGLKKFGVADVDIKTNASSYRDYYVYNIQTKQNTFTLTITVTVHNRDMAQKVQDYLITTTPTGSISPQATFSTTKQKQLESQGRDEATKDARAKADQQAKNLSFKLGAVKTVSDGGYSGGVMPMYAITEDSVSGSSKTSLSVQPGQNELNYTVEVTYYIH